MNFRENSFFVHHRIVYDPYFLVNRPESVWKGEEHLLVNSSWKPFWSFQEAEIIYDFDIYPWMQISGKLLENLSHIEEIRCLLFPSWEETILFFQMDLCLLVLLSSLQVKGYRGRESLV